MTMKNGKPNTPPQPEYAEYMTGRYAARLPEMNIEEGISEASSKSIFVSTNPYEAAK